MTILTLFCFDSPSLGPRLVNVTNASETSTLMVDPVTKSSGAAAVHSALPRAASDASKVVSRGSGLSKAFIGQKSSFSVDCSQAGETRIEMCYLCYCAMHHY